VAHLEVVVEPREEKNGSLEDQVLDLLSRGQVLTRTSLRDSLAVKNERLEALTKLALS
jgi:hypothetical protein